MTQVSSDNNSTDRHTPTAISELHILLPKSHRRHQIQRNLHHHRLREESYLFCCNFKVILTIWCLSFSSSFLLYANCDRLLSSAILSVPHIPTPLLDVEKKNQQTSFLRTPIYTNTDHDYSSSQYRRRRDRGDNIGYLAAYGLRTKLKPQQFFATKTHSVLPVIAVSPAEDSALASLNLVTGVRDDICTGHCVCARGRNAFLSINCDFQSNRKLSPSFGSNFKVPGDATSITVKLASNTNFRLEHGFFSNNTINSLTIEGTYSEREQVEITSEAFRGNNGPYPEIYMNNVFSVIMRTKAFSGNGKFTFRNSSDVILYPDAFENAKINGLFVAIRDLRMWEKAFNSAQAKLRIESSHIDNIYRFEASLREIRFINCTIGNINGGTFDVININSIIFESCRIDAIKAKAITEKLYSNHVSITGAIIGSIESEAIYGSGIAELVLTRNSIDTIHENAIHVTAINATIARNNIKYLGNNWLRVKEWSNIIVEKNQFGEFGRMLLEDTKQPVSCRFDGNSITKPLPGCLNITNPYCILREISVNIPCRCNLGWLHELSAHDLRSETYCTIDDKLEHCFNASSFNTLKYLNEVCDETKTTLDCVANMNLKKVDGHFFTPEELERHDQQIPELIFIIAGSILLIALTLVAVIIAIRFYKRTNKHSNANTSQNIISMPNINDHIHEFSLNERVTIDQTMQLMQKKYPEIYKQVNECTQMLVKSNLSKKKCVKTICQIENLMNKVNSPGNDFDAFNYLLTQHLQQPVPTAPPTADPIYSEPGLASLDGGFYTSDTIMAVPPDLYNIPHQAAMRTNDISGGSAGGGGGGVGDGNNSQSNLPEHIYAEPNCAQQPLLRNEYASPADRHIDSMDLYTEPINERGANVMQRTSDAIHTTSQPLQQQQQTRLPPYAMPVRNHHSHKFPAMPSTSSPMTTATQNITTNVFSPIHINNKLPSHTIASNTLERHPVTQPIVSIPSEIIEKHRMPQYHLPLVTSPPPPVYSTPDITRKQRCNNVQMPRLAKSEVDEFDEKELRCARMIPPDEGSDHSGGSDETVKIDDVIIYADA